MWNFLREETCAFFVKLTRVLFAVSLDAIIGGIVVFIAKGLGAFIEKVMHSEDVLHDLQRAHSGIVVVTILVFGVLGLWDSIQAFRKSTKPPCL